MKTLHPALTGWSALFVALVLASGACAQSLPSDLVQIAPADAPSLNSRGVYMMSLWPHCPPLPPPFIVRTSPEGDIAPRVVGWAVPTNCAVYFSPSLRAILVDDRQVAAERRLAQAAQDGPPMPGSGGGGSGGGSGGGGWNGPIYGTNDFWLEPVSVGSNLFNVILHGTTNGSWYLVSSTEALDPLGTNAWLPEGSLQGGTNDATPFALGVVARTNNLFIRAQACDDCANTALPLWWQLAYFGVTGVDPNGDYNGDGLNNLTEFLQGTDPNSIRFTLSVTNQYITATAVPVQLNIAGGVPSYLAVLVNDTNVADANWQAFTTTNLSVATPTDGTYVISVGLCGLATNASQTWQSVTVYRDTTPLLLVLTNPVATSGSRPFIDPAGYTTRALKTITWTMVDAKGMTNSGSGDLVAQGWSLSDRYHTTNWFQCVDLLLAVGLNAISIQAVDWAGNVAATNFYYFFDPTGDTTPPALTLVWPQSGSRVYGDSFNVQAWTDDDTAGAVLQCFQTNGIVLTCQAVLERGGNLWVFNVPLAAGTNNFSLLATDAAGNVSSTNFNVIQSSAAWAVTPLSQDDLKYGYVRVTGTIADPAAVITVNGIQGTNNGNGSWEADNVPLASGGTVALQATAQLASGETLQTLLTYVRDAIVFTQSYGYKLDYSVLSESLEDMALYSYTTHLEAQWARGAGGTVIQTFSAVNLLTGDVKSNVTVMVWPADDGYWPSLSGQGEYSYYVNGVWSDGYTFPADPPSVEWMEQSAAAGSWPEFEVTSYAESSGREVRLFTGGAGARQSQSLLDLSAGLTEESQLDPDVGHWGDSGGFGSFLEPASPPVAVPSEEISLGALGSQGSGGQLVTVRPAAAETVITPRAPGRYYGPLPAVRQWQLLTQTVSTTPTNRARTTLGVGEEVDVYLYSPTYYLPPNWSTNVSWTTTAGSVYPRTGGSTRLTAPSNAASATVTMHYNTADFSTRFDVVEPETVVRAVAVELQPYNIGQAGAGMHLTPYVGPTNVSFYRVQMMEVGQPATGISGYFLTNTPPPHDYDHKADHFNIQLGQDNSWPASYDWATSATFLPPWSYGQFTWHIPAKWKIGSGPTNDLSGSWDQVFTLFPDGTVTVQKFDHTVTRHTNEQYGSIVPNP